MTNIVTLYPTNVTTGRVPQAIGGVTTDLPVAYGGGSVGDDSDSSYLELGAYRSSTDTTDHMETASCDFSIPASAGPISLILDIRARTPATGTPMPDGTRRIFAEWRRVSDDVQFTNEAYSSGLASDGMGSLITATQSTATWFPVYYGRADASNPLDGRWAAADEYSPHGAALMGAGLRLVLYPYTTHIGGRVPMIDLFEVRLLVSCEAATTAYDIPALRQLRRGDGLGMSGAPRAIQNCSQQASLRNVGFQ